eukprot:GHVR01024506.1.p1 GENE.GHVR01024506.1~~GHVR01024506.1.p1  ORF type:complete len:124 (-),score=1.70 GHVR01024506.1:320-691(-)
MEWSGNVEPLFTVIIIVGFGVFYLKQLDVLFREIFMNEGFKILRRGCRNTKNESNRVTIINLPFFHTTKEIVGSSNFNTIGLLLKVNRIKMRKSIAINRRRALKLETPSRIIGGCSIAGHSKE